jgi:hypothetical protein
LWSHRRVGLGLAHVFFFNFVVLPQSQLGDVFFVIVCVGKRPIYSFGLTSSLVPLTSSLEARLAVSGRVRSSVWPRLVLASPAGEISPSQRAWRVGDSVSSRSAASTVQFSSWKSEVAAGSSVDASLLVATSHRLAGGEMAGGQRRRRVEHELPRKASSRFSSVSSRVFTPCSLGTALYSLRFEI